MFVLYSHRGGVGSRNPMENQMDNSIEAVSYAIRRPYVYGIELDFRLTKDGVLVVSHDGNIKQISTNKEDRDIRDMTLQELRAEKMHDIYKYYKRIKWLYRFTPESKTILNIIEEKLDKSAFIPTAEEMMEFLLATDPSKVLLLELKENTIEGAIALSDLINKYKISLPLTAHGFNEGFMTEIKNRTQVPTGLLVKRFEEKKISDDSIKNSAFDFYSVMTRVLKADRMLEMIENGKGFNFWTVDSLTNLGAIYRNLSVLEKRYGIVPGEYGINPGIITDFPDFINDHLNGGNSKKR